MARWINGSMAKSTWRMTRGNEIYSWVNQASVRLGDKSYLASRMLEQECWEELISPKT